jgi:uncharacterized protein (DUF488 family)
MAQATTMSELFTIGYEGADLGAFLRRLKAEGVSVLVDVRELPLSRRPGFSKTQLADLLQEHGIQYIHSRELGAPRRIRHELRETGDFKTYFQQFNVYLKTQRAVLERLVRECVGSVVLMCFERNPAECHRSAVARELGKLADIKPVHLDVEGHGGSISENAGMRPRQGVSAA